MKIRAFVVFVLVVCSISATVWYAGASGPSAKQKAIAEAIQSRNTPLLIQSLIARMKNQLEKNDDTFPELIREVEEYTKTCSDPASEAILHSMVAEMYHHYYQQNQWTIHQRTELAGYIPEDLREWTANLFDQKIQEALAASLQPAPLLQQTPVARYNAILTPGKSPATLRPTLYDLLIFRAIEIQPSDSRYREMLAFRRTQPDKKARLLDELAYAHYRYRDNELPDRNRYQSILDSLMGHYSDDALSNEIRIAQVAFWEQSPAYHTPNGETQDSIKALLYTLCKEGIARFPRYDRTASLKNSLNQLTQPRFEAEMSQTVYPGKALRIRLQYTNVPQVEIRIYQSLLNPEEVDSYYPKKQPPRGQLLKETTHTLSVASPYAQADTTLLIPVERTGLYECVVTAKGNHGSPIRIVNTFGVSRLATVHRSLPSGEREVWVTDYESGKPIPQASVVFYSGNGNKRSVSATRVTDSNGLATCPAHKAISAYRATLPGDSQTIPTSLYPYQRAYPEKSDAVKLSLFADRGIYRPGQTLFFKGIAYRESSDHPHVVAQQAFTVYFRDANNQEIARKEYTTNRFGSFDGSFTIPKQGLSGIFTLNAGNTTETIRVEAYKRPTFELAIEPLTAEVSFGQPLTLRGKVQTYSGSTLPGGQVAWRIESRPFWLRGKTDRAPFYTRQVANGTAPADGKGNFSFSFVPERANTRHPFYQSYDVIATLTDSKGETQESHYTFSVGETGILLLIDLPDKLDKATSTATVSARTVNGNAVAASGTFALYALTGEPADKHRPAEAPTVGARVASGHFESGTPLPASTFGALPSGRYRLEATTTDGQGRTVKAEQEVTLYGQDDQRPPVFSHTWLVARKTSCLPGEEALITFGTSDKNVALLYEIYSNNRCTERRLIGMHDENRDFRIPFGPEHGDGLTVCFSFVKEGELYTTLVPVERSQPDRRLTIRTETFRDHLLPGRPENWRFRLLNADSAAVSAEVLASMYDASLDQLVPFGWSFRPVAYRHLQVPRFAKGEGFGTGRSYGSAQINWITVPEYTYSRLNWQGVLDGRWATRRFYSTKAMGENQLKAAPVAMQADKIRKKESTRLSDDTEIDANEEEGPPLFCRVSPDKRPSLRSDFAETAFFYPVLTTDSTGRVAFGFTLPESNTTWKLQLLAHTEGLNYGSFSREVVSSKPLMVLPNLPRFMREGDRLTISTQVVNRSAEVLTGRVRLELFDPENDRPVVCLTKSERPFTLQPDSLSTARWSLPVPQGIGLVGCRIVAETDRGSDGEQHLIPVLSNLLPVTESLPFTLTGSGEKQLHLPQREGANPFRYTFELSANPVWYAIQALPALTDPADDNLLSRFAAYYSNTLAGHIARSHPRIRQVVVRWMAQGGDASTLLSQLEKNPDLKNCLLEETPWVLAAATETEQKQRLATLFDLNRAAGSREAALQRLAQEQNPDGGWSWFKGFPSSRAITLSVLKGMAHLVEMQATEYGEQEKRMQIEALAFLDKQIEGDYAQLRNPSRQNSLPTAEQIAYLHLRSSYRDLPEPGTAREAIRFYTAQAAAHWDKATLYGKGAIALLMHRNGQTEVAAQILAWLRKTATTTDEQGLFWANNRSSHYAFATPVETHCLLMAAFHAIAPNRLENDRMKQWLLGRKRTQHWESTPATLDAIHAIVSTGTDWLSQGNTCTVQWGTKSFDTSHGTAALGYLRQVVEQQEIDPSLRTLRIHKEGDAPAWGALYQHYLLPADRIGKQHGALRVEKQLFVESNSGGGLQLAPLGANRKLRVGEHVTVRLVVRTDRPMDYVVLKDLRAGCFEPARQLSGARYRDGVWFYHAPGDVSEHLFFDHLPQGTFVVEYRLYVAREGHYAGGLTTLQCLYAPEFVSHTGSPSVEVGGEEASF